LVLDFIFELARDFNTSQKKIHRLFYSLVVFQRNDMKAGMVTHPHTIIFELARDFNPSQRKFTGSSIL